MTALLERLKQFLRRLEARLTPRVHVVRHEVRNLRFVHSLWWDDAHQDSFEKEIVPYFDGLPASFAPSVILDAGAATGLFATSAAAKFQSATVHAFEPSARQRIMLRRNARLNDVIARIKVHAFGLWNVTTELAFRTHGAISTLEVASTLPQGVPFHERVPVVALDEWARNQGLLALDLVKMDIEGAEIEALRGGEATLRRFRPLLLIQAYHIREGRRTFEECAQFLNTLDYEVEELSPPSGFLRAISRSKS